MPQTCVAALCSRGTSDGVSLHLFPKNAALSKKWTRAVRVHRAKWNGPTERLTLCSLHFTKDCYEQEIQLRMKLGLDSKKLVLKPGSIPTLFPSASDEKSGSMAWCLASIHGELFAKQEVRSGSRIAFRKRQRSQVIQRFQHYNTTFNTLILYSAMIYRLSMMPFMISLTTVWCSCKINNATSVRIPQKMYVCWDAWC